jgi:hypothetical protein
MKQTISKFKKLTNKNIDNFDLSLLSELSFKFQDCFFMPSGVSPFKLYAYLSTLVNNTVILDVGTEYGNSALSFSYNQNNTIISYNIVEEGASNIDKENIVWKVMDFRNDIELDYENIKIISIDVDPHDGGQEIDMINFLKEKKWSGILLLDDIHKNNEMKNFWNCLDFPENKKYDISHIGHCSGTGLILM